MQRKTILVSIYYHGEEPEIDGFNPFYLSDAIEDAVKANNEMSDVFDVAIDETKPWLFSQSRWYTKYLFKLVRRKWLTNPY
jgi:hypothetical protein